MLYRHALKWVIVLYVALYADAQSVSAPRGSLTSNRESIVPCSYLAANPGSFNGGTPAREARSIPYHQREASWQGVTDVSATEPRCTSTIWTPGWRRRGRPSQNRVEMPHCLHDTVARSSSALCSPGEDSPPGLREMTARSALVCGAGDEAERRERIEAAYRSQPPRLSPGCSDASS